MLISYFTCDGHYGHYATATKSRGGLTSQSAGHPGNIQEYTLVMWCNSGKYSYILRSKCKKTVVFCGTIWGGWGERGKRISHWIAILTLLSLGRDIRRSSALGQSTTWSCFDQQTKVPSVANWRRSIHKEEKSHTPLRTAYVAFRVYRNEPITPVAGAGANVRTLFCLAWLTLSRGAMSGCLMHRFELLAKSIPARYLIWTPWDVGWHAVTSCTDTRTSFRVILAMAAAWYGKLLACWNFVGRLRY